MIGTRMVWCFTNMHRRTVHDGAGGAAPPPGVRNA